MWLQPVSYTHLASEMKFYENGTLVNTMANSIGLATSNNLRLLADYLSLIHI